MIDRDPPRPSSGPSVPRTGTGGSGRSRKRPAKESEPPADAAATRPADTSARGGGEEQKRQSPRGRIPWFRPSVVNVKLIYAAYLASLAIPFAAILGVVFAHQGRRSHPPAWLATHYTYQIRTFWIGLIANVIAYGLSFAGVGLLLFPLIAIWVVARAVTGLTRVAHGSAVDDPYSMII
ncbi:DUF4870 family protein [Acuticoccus mangrovi]|uniref:DUF4870 domain-containing protein n=1 Tax=Acuticoccus mangrovi TaxID=2796142 RepID=A0A934INH5_9HYPH|nr:hypothetical protein [Acuticoccus mangrovi]MBJ3775701.1 hypothetical protein [Acuticoccus mangrovi]